MPQIRFPRSFLTIVTLLTGLLLAQAPQVAPAKARLVAIMVLRSVPSLRSAALRASRAIASRISQQDGWDARVVDPHGKLPGDVAASIGAEIYIVGQYLGSPPHVVGAAMKVATDQRLAEFTYSLSSPDRVPGAVSFGTLTGAQPPALVAKPVVGSGFASIPSGDLISVAILSDIGSRISQEGDTFGVITTEDYYYKGSLILPKGSPGYGVITHLKHAGNFHAGGELNFTVKRLVTPARTDLLVETNGATADADKQTEHNGNAFGQYLLWGVGMFAQRGNDILIKKGTVFHVSTLQNENVPIAQANAMPAQLDPVVQLNATGQLPATIVVAPQAGQVVTSGASGTPSGAATGGLSSSTAGQQSTVAAREPIAITSNTLLQAPLSWTRQRRDNGSDGMSTLGFWIPPGTNSDGEWLSVATQPIPPGLTADQFASVTRQNLERSIGQSNVRIFRTTTICNGTQSGWYLESVAYVGIRQVVAEQTLGVLGNNSFVATYSRPVGSSENPDARRALDTLCPLQKE